MANRYVDEGRIEFDGPTGRGAIVFDPSRMPQPRPEFFAPSFWGDSARPVPSGGRGGAWYVDAPFGDCVLRRYLRGGLIAHLSRDAYVWQGEDRVRSVAEFRLSREVMQRGVAVPACVGAWYERDGLHYRAALLVERLPGVSTLADRALRGDAPFEAAGRIVARAHRAGLDHVDLNADNLLFDESDRGWIIDLDRCTLRTMGDGWRQRNLERLHRSLLKRRGPRDAERVDLDFARLHTAYQQAWNTK